MNPARKARKKIFLSESSKKGERDMLAKTLEIWADVLSSTDDISEMSNISEEQSKVAESSLTKNLGSVLDQTRDMEQSYRLSLIHI